VASCGPDTGDSDHADCEGVFCFDSRFHSITFGTVTVTVTVRPMLRDLCPVSINSLSVTLVYCGQAVRWNKMQLGTEEGLDPYGIVLDGEPAPLGIGAQQPSPPNFSTLPIARLSNC